jgi:GntR family transcriptional regulator
LSAGPSLARLRNVPLTARARAAILEAILEHRFQERLPAEDELAEMLNVSRTTIRAALQSLEQDGVITRKRAVGTKVNANFRPSALALQRMIPFAALLREKGYEVEIVVSWERGTPSEEMTREFGLDADQDSLLTDKVYLADAEPAIAIRDVVPWRNLRDPEFSGAINPSIFAFSDADWLRPIEHVVAEIIPAVKGGEAPTKLPIPAGTPFTRLRERHYAGEHELLAVSVVDVGLEYMHFEVFRRR